MPIERAIEQAYGAAKGRTVAHIDRDNVVTLCRTCHATAHEYVTTPSV